MPAIPQAPHRSVCRLNRSSSAADRSFNGIGFDYDSADIRAASEPVIASLYEGLASEAAAAIEIIGHSSSEGSEAYNRDLSQRRAESVVSALTQRGLSADTLSATGRGGA